MATITRTHRRQRTIVGPVEVRGVGFLTGAEVTLRFEPAPVDTGARFVRVDLPNQPSIAATIEHVVPRQRRTAIQSGDTVVELVEHVMSALSGLRIDNVRILLDAVETPGMDGSSRSFVEALERAGVKEQEADRLAVVLDQPLAVSEGNASVVALPPVHPQDNALAVTYTLDYGLNAPIPRQTYSLPRLDPDSYRRELAPCRTFLLQREAEELRKTGVGSKTKISDLVIYGPDGPIDNTLRFPDECARHKALDLVGDLALLGMDFVGQVVGHRSGHALNARLVRAIRQRLLSDSTALGIREIMEILPHRYPFLLVDRIEWIEPDRRLEAIKNVTINEPCFMGHWPSQPVLPGVLIVEALAQAGGVLLSRSPRYEARRGMLAAIQRVRFRRPIVPGDQLRLLVEVVRARASAVELKAVATCQGDVAAEAVFTLVHQSDEVSPDAPMRLPA